MYLFLTILIVAIFGGTFGSLLYWDKGRRSLLLAVRSLWLHKMRAFLSVLGIIIGTGAVIALMAFGEGSMQEALDAIRKLGATNIIVQSKKPPEGSGSQTRSRVAVYGLTQKDYNRFAVLQESGTVTRMVPMRIFKQEMTRLQHKITGQAVGTTPAYADVNTITLAMGRFLRHEDEEETRNVVVLGSRVAEMLFPFEDPMGGEVKIGSYFYVVVGVLKNRMPVADAGGQASEDYNSDAYIPLTTCNERFGATITFRQAGSFQREAVALSQVTLTVSDIEKVRATGKLIESIIAEHDKPDAIVSIPLDKLEHAEEEKNRFTRLLVLIASISLIVGGIGIMNIMLATVTERTREIGIRRALGAKRRDITMQFLIEAVVQTSVGGLLGIMMGLLIVFTVPALSDLLFKVHLAAKVHVPSIFISLFFAVVVGLAFGLYPAYRAAMLDPIEALRHE